MRHVVWVIIFLLSAAGPSLARELPTAKAAIIIKLQPVKENEMDLAIALSFTRPGEKPAFAGVRIVHGPLLLNGEINAYGFRNGDGKTSFKHPVRLKVVGREIFKYAESPADRQENGQFRISRISSVPDAYFLSGLFYAQGHLFLINGAIRVNVVGICYENK